MNSPHGSIVGTSSLRRQCQLAAAAGSHDPLLRGNVGTRLGKLDSGEYDAIILAAAGLKRLNLEARIRQPLSPEQSLPAVGQGAVGIECRLDDEWTKTLLAPLNHTETAIRVRAERAMNTRLEGGCRVPIGSYAELIDGELWLRALVGAPDGSHTVRGERRGRRKMPKRWASPLPKNFWITALATFSPSSTQEKRLNEHSGYPSAAARRRVDQPPARWDAWPGAFRSLSYPGRQLPELGGQLATSPQAICSSRYLSMPSSLPTLASSSRGCAGPRRPTILPLAAPPRWPCIRSVIDKFATR